MQEFDPYKPPEARIVDVVDALAKPLATRSSRLAAELINALCFVLALAPILVVGSIDPRAWSVDVEASSLVIGAYLSSSALVIAVAVAQVVLLERYAPITR